ncbi:SLC13 family permease [Paraferrimonas sedimenticola]|uniref:Citrate transporter-like domain-containing protein n=1 Tax=Paraferrimonas sedimenticola TaxID=375674 RepID=A0AA37VYZ5_9GAMM|nr:SLC13 family permease [Paraferrimonas sedimenticola]GLP95650.1 hypothetical protein GCM10007895_09560 [Paraferrimonas sedimenticola]
MAEWSLAAILLGLMAALISGRWPVPWVFAAAVLVSWLVGLAEWQPLLNAFVQESILALVLLVSASAGPAKSWHLRRFGEWLVGHSPRASLLKLGLSSGLLSAMANNTAVVASLQQTLSSHHPQQASRLLLPLSYFAILGGTLTLVGTSTHLMVNALVVQAEQTPIGFFEMTPMALLLWLGSAAVLVLLAPLVTPTRSTAIARFDDRPQQSGDDSLPRRTSVWVNLGFVAALALAAGQYLSLPMAMVVLLLGYIGFGVLSPRQWLTSIPWGLWVILACAFGLAQLTLSSGLADVIATQLQSQLHPLGWIGVLAGLYLLTWLMTELMTNTAAAAFSLPVALASAQQLGMDPRPFIMVVMFGASASFLSPFGYQTHLMVMASGHYRLQDYLRFGAPLALVYGGLVLTALPWFFPITQ